MAADDSHRYLRVWNAENNNQFAAISDDPSDPDRQFAAWYFDQWNQASQRRRGMTDDDRLRWLLAFLQLKIETLSAEAHTALFFDLFQFIWEFLYPTLTMQPIPVTVLSGAQLAAIQRQIADGVQALMTDERAYSDVVADPKGGWVLPITPRRVVRASALGDVETVFTVLSSQEDMGVMIVCGAADFIVRAGQHLRVCAHCRTLFVANKRQAYCKPSCSQAKRDKRKRARMRPASTDEQQWYRRQQRA
jgi:hypothetical protein